MKRKAFWICFTCFLCVSEAFYLPGLAPVNYCKKGEDSEACKVNNFMNTFYKHVLPLYVISE